MKLSKDSLKRIVKIMRYVEENRQQIAEAEQLTESTIEKEFGEDGFHMFSRYCLGGKEEYAIESQDPIKKIFLSQKGVRKLYELRGILAEEKRAEWIKWATIILAISTTSLTLATILK